MKFGFCLSCGSLYPLGNLKLFEFAEKVGFDSVWTGDQLTGYPNVLETWTTMATVAARTKLVRIAIGVTDPYRRHSAELAHMGATLDIISNGRLIFGIGAGARIYLEPYGIVWDHPVARMREAIDVIIKLWTERIVNYEGEFYKLHGARLQPKPIQKPHPPIWVAGNHQLSMKLAAELADGWLPQLHSPETYKEDLRKIDRWAESFGRNKKEIEHAVLLSIAVADDHDKALKVAEEAKQRLIWDKDRMKRFGYELPRTVKKAEELPFELVEECAVFGTPDECIEGLQKYINAGVEHIVIHPIGSRRERRRELKLFAKEILPHFKKAE